MALDLVAHEGQARGADLVQGAEFSGRIPPGLGERLEARDLGGIEVAGRGSGASRAGGSGDALRAALGRGCHRRKGDRAGAIVNARAKLAFLQRFCCGIRVFPVRERPKPGLLSAFRGRRLAGRVACRHHPRTPSSQSKSALRQKRASRRFKAMAVVVMKFGGTSVANVERIKNVARHVKREVDAGNKVAVVVSAMSGATNQLVAWVNEASPLADKREYDAVVASGEQVTAGLTAIVLQSMGIKARSWQGWQIPIETSAAHGSARISGIAGADLMASLDAGEVAVITGFQGVEPKANRIATLGRGGSDTSAVAIAVAHQGGRLRHLHGRGRCLHHRPAHRAEGAPAAEGQLRGNARDGVLGLEGASDPFGRAGHGAPDQDARAVQLRGA